MNDSLPGQIQSLLFLEDTTKSSASLQENTEIEDDHQLNSGIMSMSEPLKRNARNKYQICGFFSTD